MQNKLELEIRTLKSDFSITLKTETLVKLLLFDSSSELNNLMKTSAQSNSSSDVAISCFRHSNNGSASLNSFIAKRFND